MQLVARRLLLAIPTLFILSFIVFLMMEQMPGNAAAAVLDDAASDVAREQLCAQTHCDAPLLQRYAYYVQGVLNGDFGESARTGRAVIDELWLRLPYTLILAGGAVVVALIIGVSMGTLAALKQGTIWDSTLTGVIALSTAVPTFWLALLLVTIFSLQLRWLPVFGGGTAEHYILPIISVAAALVPGITRVTRSSILDTNKKAFVWLARSKGITDYAVYWRHIRPAAAIPIITYVGLQAVHLIGSLVTIEVVFNLPGLGGLAVEAALDRDTILLQGVTLCIAALTFLILMVVDVLNILIDPRISRTRTK